MIVISEEKQGNLSIFKKTILDANNKEISSRKVTIPLFHTLKDGFEYFVLYDNKMKVISDAFKYLNHDLQKSPYNTRSQAAFAIRLLYCYLSLTNTDINKIQEEDIKKLQFFFKGIGSITEKYRMITQRSNSTINGYMAIYRSFFTKRSIKCEALFRSYYIKNKVNINTDFTIISKQKVYENNLKRSQNQKTVPKYIGPNDFKKIFEFIINEKDKQAKIILHLMYGYGLRLGEVLGLTIEDVTEIRSDGNYIPVLILRNRISDKNFQYAKNLQHVTDIAQYCSNNYIKLQQKIIITENLYEEILEYIEESHSKFIEKYPRNYINTYADMVSYNNELESNHYIFLNRYGRILSDQTWGNKLKKYFIAANIPLDIGVKKNNLSHRFRHGFAMFHARFSEHPVDVLTLQKLMRHKNISSTMIYYNLTEEDELQIKTEFQEELYNLIPELKEGWL